MARKTSYVVLCEDTLQEVFARTYLKARGIVRGKITIKKSPLGKGAAEQFVREEFAKEVNTFRSKNYQENTALIVIIDADKTTVQRRKQQLLDMLEYPLAPEERVAIFVPKRHIETWIQYAAGHLPDEEADYHAFERRESDCKPHVTTLANKICRNPLPENAPPSIVIACQELQRIL